MLGAIAGDIIGSVYEANPIKSTDFPLFHPACRFTDDSVLTVAVAETLLEGGDYVDAFKDYFQRYPDAGYGESFFLWAASLSRRPYNSWGNGAAMRVSPVAYAFDTLDEVLEEAERCATVTHNHPLGVQGAQATAACGFLALHGASKEEIKRFVEQTIGYDLSTRLDIIRPTYRFDVSCQGSVPPAIIAFLESDSFEDAVRKAVSLGGDADTMACIAGGIAEAFYGSVPDEIAQHALATLDESLRRTVFAFAETYARG